MKPEYNHLETTDLWSISEGSEIFNRVYWLDKDGETVEIDGNTIEVKRDRDALKSISEQSLQGAMFINGEPCKLYHEQKRYIVLDRWEDGSGHSALIAFLPACNLSLKTS